ncbi:hypothetical protein [Rhodococcus sp. 14-2483-1-2]|uniref:hypothetical protein n=1 Tax=Rhodococcus sp. 14-2483-1-2 TaxID=2023147 RepID=UPI00207B1071|nr:hypothetical protein [Rhodococcus sp. 14-2483-1-2]
MTTTLIRDEALARGSLGRSALHMMRTVVTEQLPRFPLLRESGDVDDFVNGFFEDKGAGFANVITSLPDDRAAKQETRKWVERWLIDRTRKQPWGALRNRLEKRLERSDMFTPSAAKHYWFLTGDEDIDRPVTDTELHILAAEATVEVVFPTGSGSMRLGRVGQLEEMLRRLLVVAGRLHVSTLTRICAERFPSVLETGDALTATVDVDWEIIEGTTPSLESTDTTEAQLSNEYLARQLLPLLSNNEVIALRVGVDAAKLASELGIGRSSAYNVIGKLRARLTELAGDNGRSRDVLTILLFLVLNDSLDVPSRDRVKMEDSHAV